MSEEEFFVTTDRNVIEKGKLDPTDVTNIGGRKVISLDELVRRIEQEGETSDGSLRMERLEQLCTQMAKAPFLRNAAPEQLAAELLTVGQMTRDTAENVRRLRVQGRYSWRAIARWLSELGAPVDPPSNQIIGMAFCCAAANKLGEDWQAPPWN